MLSFCFFVFLLENDVRKLNVPANTVVSLTLWDIPGREDMDLHKSYFRNLDAAIGKCVLDSWVILEGNLGAKVSLSWLISLS